jgi:PadR family transcriptional regulator
VLAELACDPGRDRYGYELAKATGLASGTLYPILMRLEQRGLLEARWELGDRRPRHVYRLTQDGITAVAPAAGSDVARATSRGRKAAIA